MESRFLFQYPAIHLLSFHTIEPYESEMDDRFDQEKFPSQEGRQQRRQQTGTETYAMITYTKLIHRPLPFLLYDLIVCNARPSEGLVQNSLHCQGKHVLGCEKAYGLVSIAQTDL
jgi:hypothetical protein